MDEEFEKLYNKILDGVEDWDYSDLDKITELSKKEGAKCQLDETKKTMLNNFRKICGCYIKGKCSVNCEECTFIACETLNDLIKK